MKQILYIGLFSLFYLNSFANGNLLSKKIPLDNKFLSNENGGTLSAIDAYSDGIGIYTVGLENKKFSAMNELVFIHGEEAKKSGETLKEFVLENGSIKEKELASLLGNNELTVYTVGEACNDGDILTDNDQYIDIYGTCKGTIIKNYVECFGDEYIGLEILVDGISYLVVNDDSIWNNLHRAETLCTSNVTDMNSLFEESSFNGNLNKWDTSNVTDMSYMFFYSEFNQSLNNWDTSNVTDISYMFTGNEYFNQPLNNWDVSNVISMEGIFGYSNFNNDISNWNTSNVINMSYMFYENKFFNQNISSWNVNNVLTFENIFNGSSLFNQPLNSWSVSNAINMEGMFFQATSFNQPLNNWDTSKVNNMFAMFYQAFNFNQNLTSWNVNQVLNYSYFNYDSGLLYENRPFFN